MPIINDDEFGRITIRRSAKASQVRLRVAPDGTLRASLPMYAPTFLVKRLIKTSRTQVRELLQQSLPALHLADGMRIGKSHSLIVMSTSGDRTVKRKGQRVIVSLCPGETLAQPDVAREVREVIIAALRIEARSYLPKRLAYLAAQHGFAYSKVRFSHASGRWGSCSSEGTISLNIALMKLPFELIDYVLVHELSHTVHMNHSPAFWSRVEKVCPSYVAHRQALKAELPTI